MSYDISLIDPVTKATIKLDAPHQMKGGTFQLGGSTEAWLNVTYNYYKHFQSLGPEGIRTIYGMTGAESIPILQATADGLKDDVDDDYWQPTEGNAKLALLQLIALAKLRPDGIWKGD
jgi:hypothetical protein